tara:strand:- start:120 stop:1022 length:903 start_codon:yes stop_codon:yes gene_type:complete
MPIKKDLSYLDKSIESILNQSYKNFELIIIDNSSNKSVLKKITTYKKKDKRIKIFKKKVGNLSELLNYGVMKSKGDFVARQDSDDISHKKRFEYQINWFQKPSLKFKNKILCGTNACLIDERGKNLGKTRYVKFKHDDIKKRLLFANCFVHSSIMVNYKSLKKNFRYNKYFLYSQDYDLWTRLIQFGEVCNLNLELVKYRISKKFNKNKKFRLQTLYAIIIASNYLNFSITKKFKKFSGSLTSAIKNLEQEEKLKNHVKILRYIYGKSLNKSDPIRVKNLNISEFLVNIKNPLFLKALIK